VDDLVKEPKANRRNPWHRLRRLLIAAVVPTALFGMAAVGLATGNVPEGHIDPDRCYDPSNPDPPPEEGALKTSLLGTAVHFVVAYQGPFYSADINCRYSSPGL
jgi:hypothetical protein